MYDHIGLRVKDLDASTRFYEAVLAEQPTLIAERRFHLRQIGGA